MKTFSVFSRRFLLSSAAALGIFGMTASAQSQTNKLRVGIYDSRAVAIAYGNSTNFQQAARALRTDYEKAKAEKDEKQVKALESKGKLGQLRAHEQAFSTASVATCMATIKDSLPKIAKKAGVQIIVSKWELNYQSAEVQTVDVTDDLVALFHPSEKVLRWIQSSKAQKPIPIEDITPDLD